MKRSNGFGRLIAAGALGGAAIALGFATFTAMSGDTATVDSPAVPVTEAPTPDASERSFDLLASPAPAASQPVQWEDVQLATELAPFEESRVWSGERYQLPGERVVVQTEPQQPQREPEPPPAFEVLGTAASGGTGLAVIRVGNGTPQLVSLGQRVEGYEVASIESGRVMMRNSDRSLSLSVASAAPNGPQSERNARQGPARPQGNNNNTNNNRGNANPLAGRAQGARPAGQAGGGTAANPAAREQMVRQIQQLGQMMGAGAQVQVNGNQVIVSGPNGQQRMNFAIPGAPAPTEVQVRTSGRAP